MAKMNILVGEKNCIDNSGEGGGWSVLLEGMSYVNLLSAFYKNLPMGRKEKIFCGKLKYI